MTKDEMLAMKSGRDLDIIVALEIMEFIWIKHLLQFSAELAVKWLGTAADIEKSGGVYTVLKEGDDVNLKLRENYEEAVPAFSAEIAAAKQVVDKMGILGYTYTMESKEEQGNTRYYAAFKKSESCSDKKCIGFTTEAEAIVKVALAAV